MNKLLLLTTALLMGSSAFADIYEWTDENGVKHFTNYSPPDQARIIIKADEVPYDEAADRARAEMERLERLELARLELLEREAELERREAEVERRQAEASRQLEETLRKAAEKLEAVDSDNSSNRGGYDYGYYPYPYSSFYQRWYHPGRHDRIHLKRPSYRSHHKNRDYVKHFASDHKHTQFKSPHRTGAYAPGPALRQGRFPSRIGNDLGGRQFSRIGNGARN